MAREAGDVTEPRNTLGASGGAPFRRHGGGRGSVSFAVGLVQV